MSRRINQIAVRAGATAALAAAALTVCAAEPANAQNFFEQLFGIRSAPRQVVRPHAPSRAEQRAARRWPPARMPKAMSANEPAKFLPASATGPVTIVVSTDRQRLTVYDGEKAVAETVVSTGRADHPTPHGVFSVIEKQVFHRSNLYDDAPMPFMQRLTWSGVAMHEGHVTGRPASHGCVRLPAAFARELYRYTRRGVRVVIARENVKPTPVAGLEPFSAPATQRFVMGAAIEQQRVPGEIAPPPASIGHAPVKVARDMFEASPVSILISRKAGKLYVRRNFKAVFEVPVTIDDPNRPIGAHLFVAQSETPNDQIAWSATSVTGRTREAMLTPRGQKAADLSTPALGVEPSAQDALRRVHIAPGVAARISAMLTPGAALILTDNGPNWPGYWDGTNFTAVVK